MNANRRHKTLGSETKDIITYSTADSMNLTNGYGNGGGRWMLHTQWVCIIAEEPKVKGTGFLKWAENLPEFCPRGRHFLCYTQQ